MASMPLWRHAHFCRVRVAGIGCIVDVLQVCCRCAVAPCREDWFEARWVHVWRTCDSRGRLWRNVLQVCRRVCRRLCRRNRAVGIGWSVLRAPTILRAVTCVSRGRRGNSDACPRSERHSRVDPRGRCGKNVHLDVCPRAFCVADLGKGGHWRWIRVAALGKRARSVRFAWQTWGMVRLVASLDIVLRGRRAAADTARFCGSVREYACAGARWALRNRGRRKESVDLCGCKLGAEVSWNAVGRLRRTCYACNAVPWNIVAGCRNWRLVACAVPWELLVDVSHGCCCAMGIVGQRILSVAPYLGNC